MRTAVVLLAALVALPLPGQTSEVTIPLTDYETLREETERASATVIDTVRLAGTFRGRDLTIAFRGRTIGTRPQAGVLDNMQDVTIAGCTGAGIVTRTSKGSFAVIPTAETFEIRCSLRLAGSDRLQMHVPAAVLAVESNVSDGELITGDEDDEGGRSYSLVRQVATTGERVAATATGRYVVTLLPDATRFRYAIDVHNPNRSTSTLVVSLVSNEHLQQIDSAAPYEVEGNRYTFAIPPGDSTIAMTGELRGTAFRAPVEASLQYLLIESHPLIRPSVQTPAKRVSIAETGLAPQYRGAVAFETGTQRIAWQVTRLEALRATSYAVNHTSHTFFVPLDGPILGESQFTLRNEGAADLVLPQRPEPTFVSLGDEPVLMTKNRESRLTVPLSTGLQSVLVQHRQSFREGFGIGLGSIVVPQLDVPASRTLVRMTYPTEWIPLYESFATRAVIWTPAAAMLVLFFALALWVERLLAWLGSPLVRRFAVSIAAGIAASILLPFLVALVVVCGALTLAWIMTRTTRERIALTLGVSICGALVFFGLFGTNAQRRYSYAQSESDAGGGLAAVNSAVNAAVADNMNYAKAAPVPANLPPSSFAYQGLPAKFEVPDGARSTEFAQELLRADREQPVRVIAVSIGLVKWLGFAIALAVILVLLRDRRALAEALRAHAPAPTVEATA